MWVETEQGAVNLDHVAQIMVEDEGLGNGFSMGLWTTTGGYDRSRWKYETREEALHQINELTEQENHPLRVVEGTPDEEDTQGEGPRRTD